MNMHLCKLAVASIQAEFTNFQKKKKKKKWKADISYTTQSAGHQKKKKFGCLTRSMLGMQEIWPTDMR